MIAEWGLSAAEPRDLQRRDLRPLALAAFGPVTAPTEAAADRLADRQVGLARLVTDRTTRPVPLDAPTLADLATLAEPAWTALLDGPPAALSWSVAAGEPSARPDAPRAPSAALLAHIRPGRVATA